MENFCTKRILLIKIVEKVSAMAEDSKLGKEIKKIEKNSLQKFKNQNKVLKKFGKSGLKVYRAIRKRGISIEELMEKTKVKQEQLFEILTFLKKKGMVETVGEIEEKEPVVDEETEMVEPEGIMGEKVEETPATIAPEEEIVPEEEKVEIEPVEEEEEEGPLAPSAEIEPVEEEKAEEGVVPLDLESEAEKEPIPEGEEPVEEEKPEEVGGVVPLDLESEAEEEPVEEEKPEEKEEELTLKEEPPLDEEEEGVENEIAPSEAVEEREEEEDDEDIFLTPGERKIKAEYGQVGIDVYNLIDGQRTAEEIMKSTGVTETKLIEMLDFMEKKGIIKLEHPGAKKKAAAPRAKMPDVKEIGFAPMLEEGATPEKPLGGELGKKFTLEVPTRTKGNMLREIQMKANLMIKYKKPGMQLFELIEGNRDAVELALKVEIPLYRVYKILAYLEKEGMITLAPSTREDIKRKYGTDGYSVYKKYGREGVMLYQLVGKDLDLREMAIQTSEDKLRVVKIFMFIHKLLGIDLPIDEDVLLERLESTAPGVK